MSAISEKDNSIGVTITRPSPVREYSARDNMLSTIDDVESTRSLTPTQTTFTQESITAVSRDQSPSRSPLHNKDMKFESKNNVAVYETDVEAGLNDSRTNVLSPYSSIGKTQSSSKPCTVWPGRQQLKERRNALRTAKGWHPLAKFDKRTRILIKIAVGLALVGLIVGVGVGITKAVGGGVWHGLDQPSAHP